MSFLGRPKKSLLSSEEFEQQRADRLKAQEKAKKEKAEKRKKNNKGYGSRERKSCTRRESATFLAKPSSSSRETSNFGARFPVEGSLPSVVLHNEASQSMEYESVSYQTEVPKNFPVDFTKEFIDNQVECINFLKFTEKDFPDESGKSQIKEKKIFEDDVESGWDVTMVETAYKALVEVYGFSYKHSEQEAEESREQVGIVDNVFGEVLEDARPPETITYGRLVNCNKTKLNRSGLSRHTLDRILASVSAQLEYIQQTFAVETILVTHKPTPTSFSLTTVARGQNVKKLLESETGQKMQVELRESSKKFPGPNPEKHLGYRNILLKAGKQYQIEDSM